MTTFIITVGGFNTPFLPTSRTKPPVRRREPSLGAGEGEWGRRREEPVQGKGENTLHLQREASQAHHRRRGTRVGVTKERESTYNSYSGCPRKWQTKQHVCHGRKRQGKPSRANWTSPLVGPCLHLQYLRYHCHTGAQCHQEDWFWTKTGTVERKKNG